MADLDSLIEQLEEAGHHVGVGDHVNALFNSQVKKPYFELLQRIFMIDFQLLKSSQLFVLHI